MFCHNGILSSFVEENEHSDSFVFFKRFLEEFNKTKDIKKSIKKLLNKTAGSYSIAIYDKKEKALYYFKNSCTSINFCLSEKKDLLFISTSNTNCRIFEVFSKYDDYSIDDYTIYKITFEKKIKIQKVGTIKPINEGYGGAWSWVEKTPIKEKDILEVKAQLGVTKGYKTRCSGCGDYTRNWVEELEDNICDDCLLDLDLEEYYCLNNNYKGV